MHKSVPPSLTRIRVVVPCFGHVVSELFLQTEAVEVVFCFNQIDDQKQWFVC
jgi:hypothetical protein